jgi:hypothetical protein
MLSAGGASYAGAWRRRRSCSSIITLLRAVRLGKLCIGGRKREASRENNSKVSRCHVSPSDADVVLRRVSNFGRQLTHSRHQALNFGGEAFIWKKIARMACGVDTGAVFKHPVHCSGCDQAFYFTLRKIAEAKKLACPLCGSDINLTDEAYGFIVTKIRDTVALIDKFAASSAN